MSRTDDEKAVISRRPLRRRITRVKRERTVAKSTSMRVVARPSKIPFVLFLAVTCVALIVAAAALMIPLMTGGRQTKFSEDILAIQLVPVETAAPAGADKPEAGDVTVTDAGNGDDLPDVSHPNLIDLSGDPIVTRHGGNVA